MQIHIDKRLPSKQQSVAEDGCQIIFLFSDGKLVGNAKKINAESDGLIKYLYKSGDFVGRHSQTLVLRRVPGCIAPRLLLVGLGTRESLTLETWRSACVSAAMVVNSTKTTHVVSDATASLTPKDLDPADMAEALIRELVCSNYRFALHQRSSRVAESTLAEISICATDNHKAAIETAAARGRATALGMATCRDLGNLAPNLCTPEYLAEKAVNLADQHDRLSCSILEESDMEELGMGALLAVSSGSEVPARLICLNYQGRKRAGSPVVLVGKGITFDTGGISIKPSAGLDEMKFDMCGAASVFGVIDAVARLQLEVNLIGLIAAAENMPDGRASRPGDVVTSMSGLSIEILNTDAEGRLVMCDALTYAERFKPAVVIDVATLTGACVVALGKSRSGIMGNHQPTVDQLLLAGEKSGDKAWQLPIDDEYQSLLDSNFADIANIGGRPAGAITAACFLSRFATRFSWAHIDIAGIASVGGKNKGATGRPVPMLMEFLYSRLN